jgi:penicillin-binding protein 1B
MSLLLEWHYSKRDILETYLNVVYLGQSGPHGVHGFGLGARHYFGKGADQLTVPEIALLVGMVKGASFYNPWRNPERAKERRNVIVGVMLEQGLITAEEARAASAAGLGVVSSERRRLQNYPAFLDLVRRQLRSDYSDAELSSEGLKIFTTLVPGVQRRAENALKQRLPDLEKRFGIKDASLQGSVVVTAVGSGDVLALVGDRNPQFVGFNRALDVQRPIGSLNKPAVFLAALESGTYNWATLVSDAPVSIKGQDGVMWEPRNYNRRSHGDVLMIDALTYSYNQATTRLGMKVGLKNVQKTMVGLAGKGLAERFPPYPSILLGAVNLSPLEVAGMYHTIANDGVRAPLRAIQAVVDSKGRLLSRYNLSLETVISSSNAYLLQYGLQAVMQRGTGRGAYKVVPGNIILAGKTGTTNDQRDSWFAGFSDNYLAVVWLGRDDNGKTPLTGSSGALAVWSDLFAALPARSFRAQEEPSIVSLWIDDTNGRLTREHCDGARMLPFEVGFEPMERSDCQWLEPAPVRNWFNRLFGGE